MTTDTSNDPEAALAHRIRGERDARGWSLADLAQRSGVSKAMISKVERGEASPTAATLVRLAAAFEMTLARLLTPPEQASRLIRAADQPAWRDPASGYVRRQIYAAADFPLELVRVELPPGARVAFPAASYAQLRQVVWLIDGALTIEEGPDRHHLQAGDAFAFGDPADCAFVNSSKQPATYAVAVVRGR